jgi:hypothetical protein
MKYTINRLAVVSLVLLFVLFTPALAQQALPKLTGNFVFSEEGLSAYAQPVTALAALTFSDTGTVTGREAVLTQSGIIYMSVQGTWSFQSAHTGTMNLVLSMPGPEDDTITTNQVFCLMPSPSGDWLALRTGSGYYATGRLTPAATQPLAGAFVLTERSGTRPMARIMEVNFAGGGAVTGLQVQESLGVTAMLDVKGTFQLQEGGFIAANWSSERPDAEGEIQSLRESYVALATANEVRMIRTAGGVHGIVTLSK